MNYETNTISFRKAETSDALFIAKGFHMAMLMEDIQEEAIKNFAKVVCTRNDVLYSARNTIIAECNGTPTGMITAYDGRKYRQMREKTFALLKEHFGWEFPGMEDETVAGEYYLDSLAVWPQFRNAGIGKKLLEQAIKEGTEKKLAVTLVVDPINEKAKQLYESLGFEYYKDIFIFGHDYQKMMQQKH